MRPLLEVAMESVLTKARGVLDNAEQQRTNMLAEVATERAKGLAEVAEERAKSLIEIDANRSELQREIASMHMQYEAQQGRVELNIGGYRFETSAQTLRRVPQTFFHAYFSGNYAQDVCADGSIFVDRDGEHFGHILEYMRDGVMSVAEPGARPSVDLLIWLKREFGFYSIELCAEEPAAQTEPEVAFLIGGSDDVGVSQISMERYDASSKQWSVVAAQMGKGRYSFGTCVISGMLYVTGGMGTGNNCLSSVEKYTLASDTWSFMAAMPATRAGHAAVAVGSVMYVVGGHDNTAATTITLKFDSALGTWSRVAPMPATRYSVAACAIGSDIFVFGGRNSRNPQRAPVLKYDTLANTWSTLQPMPQVYSKIHASVLDGLIYIVGGGDGHDVWRYDPESSVWSALARTLNSRNNGSSMVIGGVLTAVGGDQEALESVEHYDVATNTWTAAADMREGRSGLGAVTFGSSGPDEEQGFFDVLIAKATRRQLSAPARISGVGHTRFGVGHTRGNSF
jgi:N-acetylneuraminic acid mutarotase